MNGSLYQSWWVPALRGLVALAFGLVALWLPVASWLVLVGLFAVYAILGGTASVAGALRQDTVNGDWWLGMVLGLAGITAGALAVLVPGLTMVLLLFLIGAYALVAGVLDLVMAVRLRKLHTHAWLLLANGLLSLIFGALVYAVPGAAAMAIAWVVGAYAILSGVLLLALAWRMHGKLSLDRRVEPERRSGIDRRADFAHQPAT